MQQEGNSASAIDSDDWDVQARARDVPNLALRHHNQAVAVDRFNLPNHKRPEQKLMVVIPEVSCGAISESRQVSMSKSNFAPQTGPSKRTRARAWDRLGL